MNLLHVIDEPYDSGIVHYALTAANGLRERGHTVLACGLTGRAPLEQAAGLGLETAAVRRFPAGVLDLRRLLRQRPFQLINAHTGTSHALAVAATRAMRRPPAIVRTRGDARPLRRGPGSALLWRRTAGFIAPSNRILNQFLAAYPKLTIQARALLPGLPDPGMDGKLQETSSGGPLRVGMIGRLDPVKGHLDFLRAAAKVARAVPEAAFVLAGREEHIDVKYLLSAAAGLGISRFVEFLGHVPNVLDIMRACHVGVIASIGSEAISRVAIEWMSVGKPLVATSVGCLPEIVIPEETGFLVEPRDHDAMGRRLTELLRDPALSARLGRSARQRFDSHFTLKQFVGDMERFYEDIVRGISSR